MKRRELRGGACRGREGEGGERRELGDEEMNVTHHHLQGARARPHPQIQNDRTENALRGASSETSAAGSEKKALSGASSEMRP